MMANILKCEYLVADELMWPTWCAPQKPRGKYRVVVVRTVADGLASV